MHWQALLLTAAMGQSDGLEMLEFTADWCPACRTMEATVDRLIRNGHSVRRVIVDREPDQVARYRVVKMPTFVLVKDGKEVGRIVGPTSYARLEQMIRRARPPTRVSAPAQQSTVNRATANLPLNPPAAPLPARPTRSLQQKILQATVRLEVRDQKGINLGSGTLIDSRDGHALVLTCGHLFRDSQGTGQIVVELFLPQQRRKVPGQLIRYDSERDDIALLKIQPGVNLPFLPVASAATRLQAGQPVWNAGCDRGDEPTVKQTRINSINRYHGPDNIQVEGMPADGRSGGGLFNAAGELIGVCNAADPLDEEGFYSSLPNVRRQIRQAGLAYVMPQPAPAATVMLGHLPGRNRVVIYGPDGQELMIAAPTEQTLRVIVQQAEQQGRAIPDGIWQAAGLSRSPRPAGYVQQGRPLVIRGQSREAPRR